MVETMVEKMVTEGAALSAGDAAALERALEQRPDDLDARARLLGFHRARARDQYNEATPAERMRHVRESFLNGTSVESQARAHHALWLAQNAPRAPLAAHRLVHFHMAEPAYAELSSIWRRHAAAEPPDATLLAHAIAFFWSENETFAGELLTRAEQLFPDDGRWPRFRRDRQAKELWFEHLRRRVGEPAIAIPDDPDKKAALERVESLLRGAQPGEAWMLQLRPLAADLCLALGHVDRAREHAEQMLVSDAGEPDADRDPDGESPNAAHDGHLLLGRIALRGGDVDRAKAHLTLAGQTGPTGLVTALGPDMRLARDLLVRGERDVVIRYLTACRAFWRFGPADEWIAAIRAGRIPDFGRNLER